MDSQVLVLMLHVIPSSGGVESIIMGVAYSYCNIIMLVNMHSNWIPITFSGIQSYEMLECSWIYCWSRCYNHAIKTVFQNLVS